MAIGWKVMRRPRIGKHYIPATLLGDGSIALTLLSEANYPSTGASVAATRTGGGPYYVTSIAGRSAFSTPIPLTVKGAWTPVPGGYGLMDDIPGVTYPTA